MPVAAPTQDAGSAYLNTLKAYQATLPIAPNASGYAKTFGSNIAPISTPSSVYDELNQNVPDYASMSGGAQRNINDELSGNLSQGTQNLLQNKAAAFGINSGIPGGTPGNTLTTQNFLDSLGLSSEGLAHQGITDYNQFSNTTGNQQLSPELAFGVSSQNAVDAAAPNPAAAASYSQSLYDKYLNQNKNPAAASPTDPDAWKLNGDISNVPGQSITGGDSTSNYAKTASQAGTYT